MFVSRKPHPFGNNYHTIACAKYKVIYNVEIVEGKDRPRGMGKKEFEENGATPGLMVSMKNTLCGTWKVVILHSGLYIVDILI